MTKSKRSLLRVAYAAMCLALALVLPLLTMNDITLGNLFSLMHIPVLLCGFLCGWQYGAVVGFVAPLLRFLIFGRPPILTAVPMAFELLVYGLIVGIMYKALPKKSGYIYVTLITSMIAGRIAGGVAKLAMLGLGYLESFTLSAWFTSYFAQAVPAIVLHIVLVPLVVMALEKEKLVLNE